MRQKVLIVDDHSKFRQLARRLVEAAGYAVIGEAGTASEAISETHRLVPDVVLLDIHLPDRDGFAVASALRALPSAPIVVLISSRDATDYGPRVRECGAQAFISKAELTGEQFKAAVEQ
jgi:DNA-binding NarL/FixJ family response regulator